MRPEPKPAQPALDCKLKRVYPRLPLRVHSAAPKGFAGNGSGNPPRPEPTAGDAVGGSEWSADRVRIRLENALSSEAWRRLESAARRHGRSVEDLFLRTLAEAS
jgi:hypothetical protein